MYASIFGNMVAIVQRLYSKASSFHNHMNMIREFLRFYKIPEELRISIVNYVRREWTVSRGVDIESVLYFIFLFIIIESLRQCNKTSVLFTFIHLCVFIYLSMHDYNHVYLSTYLSNICLSVYLSVNILTLCVCLCVIENLRNANY